VRVQGLVAASGLAVASDLSVDALIGLPDPCRDQLDRLTSGDSISDLDPIILRQVARGAAHARIRPANNHAVHRARVYQKRYRHCC
jgi:hypothetical protein